jgi:predicted O-methyltransferase YrrM
MSLKSTFFQKLTKYLNGTLHKYFRTNHAFDIATHLRQRALDSTCAYIEENMMGLPLYETKIAAMDHALREVTLNGLYCEFGVYKGNSVNYIAKKIQHAIHAFDSFEGLPETWLSSHQVGHFAVKDMPLFEKNVVVHKGWFDDTLPTFIEKEKGPLAFLHIDCDLYSSTKTIFTFLNSRIVKGTIIIFDEYFNYPFWQQHEYKAFQEFVKENKIEYQYLCYSSRTFGAKVAVKIVNRQTLS